jgi:UDP-glucuronate 4-epimerase
VIEKPVEERVSNGELYKVYNIGNNNSVKLMDFIKAIEENLGKEAEKNMLPIQPGDVERTWANVDDLIKDYDYQPATSVQKGVKKFVEWYKDFYEIC